MVIHKVIELTDSDIQVYNRQLESFIELASNNRVVTSKTFHNVRDNCLELSNYLGQTTTELDSAVLSKSISLIDKAVPLMESFDIELSRNLEKNSREIKSYMKDRGLKVVELSEPQVENVTDYPQIARIVIKALTEEEEPVTLGMKLRGYRSPSIEKIAREMVDSNKGVPIKRKTSNVYQHIADHLKEVDRTGVAPSADNPIHELFAGVISKMQAERKEEKKEEQKKLKWFERHEND